MPVQAKNLDISGSAGVQKKFTIKIMLIIAS